MAMAPRMILAWVSLRRRALCSALSIRRFWRCSSASLVRSFSARWSSSLRRSGLGRLGMEGIVREEGLRPQGVNRLNKALHPLVSRHKTPPQRA